MQQLKTILYLAPSAVGKSTAVEQLKRYGGVNLHLDRDAISWNIRKKYRAATGITGAIEPVILDKLLMQGYDEYQKRHAQALAGRISDTLVIDFVPSPRPEGWAEQAVLDNQRAGREVHLIGLYASPETGLQRLMRRNTMGQDMTGKQPEVATNRGYFESWLATYMRFPEQFLAAALITDTAVLYDNSALDKMVIATWDKGMCSILDEATYEAFLNLRNVNPKAAQFTITGVDTQTVDGVLVHYYRADTSNFFGATPPSQEMQRPISDIARDVG